ncbi:replicative DNA helicase [Corynebacterium sp. MSK073]|uniref:replicative DNA helicase n=1 Tax=Corynebacterium sp. MSK073 TaxID=3050198 RepID=UPI00254BD51A|nr:replicative DNA helicase [Corynebacterium sp. MSK073]MDK8815627.1 replicative DNA helicase [Corynebacterium sp. MSK073]
MEDFYDAWDTPTEDFFDTYSDSLYTTTTLKKSGPETSSTTTAETRLLGAALTSPDCLDTLVEELEPWMLSPGLHRHIYATVQKLHADGVTPSPEIVEDQVIRLYGDVHAHLPAHLRDYASQATDLGTLQSLCDIVANEGKRRRYAKTFEQAREDLLDPTREVDDTLATLLSDVEETEADQQKTGYNASQAMDAWEASYEDDTRGLKFHIPPLDELFFGGLKPGNLVVIGAAPGAGKTTLAMDFMRRNAARSVPGCFFSYEMDVTELTEKLISATGNIPYAKLRKKQLSLQEREGAKSVAQKLSQQPFWVFDETLTLEQVMAVSRIYQRKEKIKYIVVDYAGLVPVTNGSRLTELEALSRVTRELKKLAKSLGIVVILLSQMNRDTNKSGTPSIFGFRGSASLEQDANAALLCWRSRDPEDSDTSLHIKVGKNRGGVEGEVAVDAQLGYSRFGVGGFPGQNIDESMVDAWAEGRDLWLGAADDEAKEAARQKILDRFGPQQLQWLEGGEKLEAMEDMGADLDEQ